MLAAASGLRRDPAPAAVGSCVAGEGITEAEASGVAVRQVTLPNSNTSRQAPQPYASRKVSMRTARVMLDEWSGEAH